ncbi:MAG TPA: heme exporter protein CcmD [Steroidobacteraceae bacterium]|nr:heme exporter protein CcmD [Steroidobacteraceae bacterium]
MMQWLAMGGYWMYVWPSYLLTFLVLVLNVGFAQRSAQRARQEALRRTQSAAAQQGRS